MPIQYLSNTSPTMPRVIAISGPIKPTGGGSCRISHWFPWCTKKRDQPAGFGRCRIACRYPSAEFGWCRIVCRHLSRLRIIPGIENSARLPLLINFMTGWQELCIETHNLLEIPPSLRIIPTKYNIIVRLWTYAFHILESLHRAAFASPLALEHLQDFIYYAYIFYTGLEDPTSRLIYHSSY